MTESNERPLSRPTAADWQAAEEELLGRVREVAKRIVERVREVMDDTADRHALPGDGTGVATPVT